MPDVGAKDEVKSLGETMAQIKTMLAGAMQEVRDRMLATGERMAKDMVANGDLVVKKMEAEHQAAMESFSEVLGNERAGDNQ